MLASVTILVRMCDSIVRVLELLLICAREVRFRSSIFEVVIRLRSTCGERLQWSNGQMGKQSKWMSTRCFGCRRAGGSKREQERESKQ